MVFAGSISRDKDEQIRCVMEAEEIIGIRLPVLAVSRRRRGLAEYLSGFCEFGVFATLFKKQEALPIDDRA